MQTAIVINADRRRVDPRPLRNPVPAPALTRSPLTVGRLFDVLTDPSRGWDGAGLGLGDDSRVTIGACDDEFNVAGGIFHDGFSIAELREHLSWYDRSVLIVVSIDGVESKPGDVELSNVDGMQLSFWCDLAEATRT